MSNDKSNLYDRILEYLFDRQDVNGYINIFNDDFKDVDRILLREKVQDLSRAGRIEVKKKMRVITGDTRTDREWSEYNNILDVKIKYPGGIEYVTQLRSSKKSTENNKIEVKAEQIGVLNLGDIENNGSFTQSSFNRSNEPKIPEIAKPTFFNNILKGLAKRLVEITVGILIGVVVALIIWKITGQV